MNYGKIFTRVAAVMVVGLMSISVAQAQSAGNKTAEAVAGDSKFEICTYDISGMNGRPGMVCGACTNRVKTALMDVEGVMTVESVDIESGTATVTIAMESDAKEAIPAAIADAGFLAILDAGDEEDEVAEE